jgi:hypothetical protein
LKRTTAFRALEESNKQSQIVFIGLIGPSGFSTIGSLLLLAVPVSVSSVWGWKKVSKENLAVRNIFAG